MKPQEKRVIIESLALLIAWSILTWLAQGLADADKIGGLNGRYVQDLLNSNYRLRANYSMCLADHVSYVWGMFSLAIFASNNLGRCAFVPGAIVFLNLSIWTMTIKPPTTKEGTTQHDRIGMLRMSYPSRDLLPYSGFVNHARRILLT